jgi:uncharacterized protein YuzE
MKLQYDPSVDAAYLFISDGDARPPIGFTYPCDPEQVDGQIHLDFDVSGRLCGVEILNASKKLSPDVLKQAVVVPGGRPRRTASGSV